MRRLMVLPGCGDLGPFRRVLGVGSLGINHPGLR